MSLRLFSLNSADQWFESQVEQLIKIIDFFFNLRVFSRLEIGCGANYHSPQMQIMKFYKWPRISTGILHAGNLYVRTVGKLILEK
jgi:hypothetical protein